MMGSDDLKYLHGFSFTLLYSLLVLHKSREASISIYSVDLVICCEGFCWRWLILSMFVITVGSVVWLKATEGFIYLFIY